MTQQLIPPQKPLVTVIRAARGPAIEPLRVRIMLQRMALKVSGAGEGAVAAAVSACKALLARGRSSRND